MKMKNGILRKKFELAVSEFRMLDTPSVLVGLSGGADSSVLLFLLLEYCKKNGVAIFAAHVNHSIRGDEALRDRDFCVSLCRGLGIELFVKNADVPALAKESGKGIEECARDVRYAFFESVMQEHGIKTLATAHNADDNLETLIFNMLRGAGTKGLSGIPPTRFFSQGQIVRPLIYAKKSEIIEFADTCGIAFVTDSTNSDTDYTRNHIRANIVPALKKIVSSPEDAAARLSDALRADERFIQQCANDFMSRVNIKNRAPTALIASLDDALFFRVISRMCPVSLEYTHIREIRKLVKKGREGARLSLPGRTLALIDSGNLTFCPEDTYVRKEVQKSYRYDLAEGANRIPECEFTVNITKSSQNAENIYKKFIHTSVPFDKIEGQLYVRNRKSGDRYTFGGMTRRVKKLFCDKKIPIDERDVLPIICDDAGILWIPGFPPRINCEKNDTDKLNIYIEKNKK